MIYTTLLLIGLVGLFAQAVLGMSHGSHAGHTGHAGRAGSAHGHGASHGSHGDRGPSPLWTLLSPLAIFSLCLGAGATGLLLHPIHLAAALTTLAALEPDDRPDAAAVRPGDKRTVISVDGRRNTCRVARL